MKPNNNYSTFQTALESKETFNDLHSYVSRYFLNYEAWRRHEIANDVTQRTLLSVLEHLEKNPNKKVENNWVKEYMYRSARNRSLDYIRNRNRREEKFVAWTDRDIVFDNFKVNPKAFKLYDSGDQFESLLEFVETLPPRQQEIIRLRYEWWENADIAEKFWINAGSVRNALTKIRQKLLDWNLSS